MQKLKYVNTGVVFQEIPDETTLAINISNCPCHCPGCHSSYLWQDVGIELNEDSLNRMLSRYGNDITCVCFMGGDACPEAVEQLASYLHREHPYYRVGWYSGRLRLPSGINRKQFNYIKIGPYIRTLGPLKSRTTNQRLYKQLPTGEFADITSRFWH